MPPSNNDRISNILEKLYYNITDPVAFAGAQPLIKRAKHEVQPIDIKNWLQSQDTYTLYKPARQNFKRNQYIVNNINDIWQADLVDLQSLSKHNDGMKYLLTVIDIFSKKAYVEPLKTKKAQDIVDAFERIIKHEKSRPRNLQTDKGSEFIAEDVQTFFKKNNINHFTTQNPDVKAAVVERFNRTLKTRMWRYLHYTNAYRYIDVLNDLVDAYNSSYHRTIHMAPSNVNPGNILTVYHNTYGNLSLTNRALYKKPKFKVGDYVRLVKGKGTFEKGYETNFTEEVFKVKKVIGHPLPTYEIEDLSSEHVDGKFYEVELQKVVFNPDAEFKIDKILRTKGKGTSKQVFVKWRGYPDSFNSWINAKDLVNV
ncbi:uncharacterized protein LOC135847968 [Planococcus citri]|uniref:uncharacterized protein LOC135847968 n=1 Tax=Planococcus citri TaxID=170843 RepID=UPI0031F8E350